MNINVVVLSGRLTRDVDLRFSGSGVAIANIGICVNRRRKKGDDWVDEPVFVDVKMFGKRAEAFAKHHGKGDACCFPAGELVYESWEKDGVARNKLVVHADSFEFVPRAASAAPAEEDTPF